MSEMETHVGQAVFVRPGAGGWGRGLTLRTEGSRTKVLSVTGGGIHPVAARIAELIGGEAVDGFTTSVPDEEVVAAVINCGGTARIGVYPRKGIPTVDVYPGAPGGPLAKFITEELFVSAVGVGEIEPSTSEAAKASGAPAPDVPAREERPSAVDVAGTVTGAVASGRRSTRSPACSSGSVPRSARSSTRCWPRAGRRST
ncbi:hypothetical protein ACFSVJ_07900 [Prauserella oleivorans]